MARRARDAKDLPPECSAVARVVGCRPPLPTCDAVADGRQPRHTHTGRTPGAGPGAARRRGTMPRGPRAGLVQRPDLEARERLLAGEPMVWDALTRKFEARLIHTALALTRGRRIEAAQKLGIGRNTITRKIQELGLDDK